MFCKYCGRKNIGGVRFCAGCGKPMPVSMKQSGSVARKKKKWKNILVAIVAIVVAVAICIGVIINTITSKPIPALALGMRNFSEELLEMESGHLSMDFLYENDSMNFECDFEVDKDQHIAYVYGIVENMNREMACCIDGNEGAIAVSYDGEIETEFLSSSDLKAFWSSLDDAGKQEEIDLEELFEQWNLSDEISEYVYLDEVNDAYENFVKALSKRNTQKKMEKALQIKKKGFIGEKTYSMDMDTSNLADFSDILLDILDEEAGDAIRGDWLNELRYESSQGIAELDEENWNSEAPKTFGDISWQVKGKKLTCISMNMDLFESSVNMEFNASYDLLHLKEFYVSSDTNIDGENMRYAFMVDEINKIKYVKDYIPNDMLREMNMD